MSTVKPPSLLFECAYPTGASLSARQATECGLNLAGTRRNISPDAPLLTLRACTLCRGLFVIESAKLRSPKLGAYCSRSCVTRARISRTPVAVLQERHQAGLGKWQKVHGSWNVGVPMRESAREKLSAAMKAKGDLLAARRGGNGTGMSPCEAAVAPHLPPGWVWNFVVQTKPLIVAGWTGLPTHYKLDFAWPETLRGLEVDGRSHNTRIGKLRDAKKTAALGALGWSVSRMSNAEIRLKCGT